MQNRNRNLIQDALWSVAQVAQKTTTEVARHLAEEGGALVGHIRDVSGPLGQCKFNRDYRLQSNGQTATAGPCSLWRLYSGVAKQPNAIHKEVSVWVLDKKALVDSQSQKGFGRSQDFDLIWEQQRFGCAQMIKLKHPGVVKIIEPLEETTAYMVLVTEPLRGSLQDVTAAAAAGDVGGPGSALGLGPGSGSGGRGVTSPPSSSAAAAAVAAAGGPGGLLGSLEVKLGLLGLIDALTFLHNNAQLVHLGLSPQTVMVSAEGAWKLACFCFTASCAPSAPAHGAGQGGGPPGGGPPYQYLDPFPQLSEAASKPSLSYTAPELVASPGGINPWQAGAGPGLGGRPAPAADSFSLGCLMYELVGGQQLLPVRANMQQYGARVAALAGQGQHAAVAAAAGAAVDWGRIPAELQGPLRELVSPSPAARAPVASLVGCAWLAGDTLLRALRFLEGMLQSEPHHKAAFLRDLSGLWPSLDAHLLRHKVLPPLMQELRSGGPVALAALPICVGVMGRLGRSSLAPGTLAALQGVVEGASGDMLAALVGQAEALAGLMDGHTLDRVLLPMLMRAAGAGATGAPDPRVQHAALQQLHKLLAAGHIDCRSSEVRTGLLPVLHQAVSRTTSAAVRSCCLGLMADLSPRLERQDGEALLATCTQLLSFDTSAGTILGCAKVMEVLGRAWGAQVAAQRLLPPLLPLLLAPSLSEAQLQQLNATVQGMLSAIVQEAQQQVASRAALTGASAATAAAAPAAAAAAAAFSTPLPSQQQQSLSTGMAALATWDPVASSAGSSTRPASATQQVAQLSTWGATAFGSGQHSTAGGVAGGGGSGGSSLAAAATPVSWTGIGASQQQQPQQQQQPSWSAVSSATAGNGNLGASQVNAVHVSNGLASTTTSSSQQHLQQQQQQQQQQQFRIAAPPAGPVSSWSRGSGSSGGGSSAVGSSSLATAGSSSGTAWAPSSSSTASAASQVTAQSGMASVQDPFAPRALPTHGSSPAWMGVGSSTGTGLGAAPNGGNGAPPSWGFASAGSGSSGLPPTAAAAAPAAPFGSAVGGLGGVPMAAAKAAAAGKQVGAGGAGNGAMDPFTALLAASGTGGMTGGPHKAAVTHGSSARPAAGAPSKQSHASSSVPNLMDL